MQGESFAATATMVLRCIRRRRMTLPEPSSPTMLQLFLPRSMPRTAISIESPFLSPNRPPLAQQEGRAIHKGAERNALGRSRGGFSTKINARTNAEGLPIGIVITPGQAHDVTAFPALMQEIDCDPEQMLGDKGYDSEAVRNDIEERGGEAAIPSTATRKIQHAVDKALYALRNRIECFFNRAKNSRRIATRYDKLIESFAAFVLLASIRIWIKFVHIRRQ